MEGNEGRKKPFVIPYPQRYGGTVPDDAHFDDDYEEDNIQYFTQEELEAGYQPHLNETLLLTDRGASTKPSARTDNNDDEFKGGGSNKWFYTKVVAGLALASLAAYGIYRYTQKSS